MTAKSRSVNRLFAGIFGELDGAAVATAETAFAGGRERSRQNLSNVGQSIPKLPGSGGQPEADSEKPATMVDVKPEFCLCSFRRDWHK